MVAILSRKTGLPFFLPKKAPGPRLIGMDPYKRKALRNFLIAFWLSAALFCLVFFLRATYSVRSGREALFLDSQEGGGYGGMIFVVRSGSFDVLNYGVYRLFESFRLDRTKRWDSAGDYKLDRQSKRQKNKPVYWPCLAVSGAFFLAALVLALVALFA